MGKRIEELYNDKFENILPKFNDDSSDCIFVDFPYNTTRAKWDTPVDLEVFWKEAWRILKTNGVVIATAQVPFNITLGASQIKFLKYEWIWEKTQATGHLNAKKMPMKAHENVMIFYKKPPTYNFIKTHGHERKVSSAKSRAGCIDRRNKKEDYIYNKEIAESVTGYDSTERYPRSVLTFATDKQTNALHPTQKPEALVKYFLKTYTNKGDTVVDPCMGSGTTKVVCEELGLNFKGIEKDEKWFKIATERNPQRKVQTNKTV